MCFQCALNSLHLTAEREETLKFFIRLKTLIDLVSMTQDLPSTYRADLEMIGLVATQT